MSKGFGAVQRRVLAEIARLGSADTFQLAVAVFELKPSKGGATYLTAAQLGSVRRAVRRLEKLGFVYRDAPASRRSRHTIKSAIEQGRCRDLVQQYARKLARRHGIARDE